MNFKDLPDLFDKIESKVRALKTVRIRQEQVGPSLVPIFLETLPNVVIFQISRNLRKDNWSTCDFLECIKNFLILFANAESYNINVLRK